MSFISSSSGSNLSSGSGKKIKKSKAVAVERSLQAEFDQSEMDGGDQGQEVDSSGIGDNQAQAGGNLSDLDCSGDQSRGEDDDEPLVRRLCDLEGVYPATESIVAEVLELKAELQRDRLSFESRFLPGEEVKLSRNYRKAAKNLTQRFKCNLAFAKCLLELSRRVLGGVRAHLGLAVTIAHIWNGTLKRPSPPKPAVLVDESKMGSEGDDGSDVSSLPMMNDELGNPEDLGQLDIKADAKAQQKVLAYLTSERVSAWMRAHGCADTLQGWVSDICQLMDKNGVPGSAGKKSPVSPPKSPSSKVGSPPKAKGGAAAGADGAAAKAPTAKKRVQPSLVQQLGTGYRLGGAPAEPKPAEGPPATGERVGVGLLAKRKKHKEHQVARVAAALAVPRTPGLMYSAPLLNMPVLSDELWELTRTVQKVLKRRPDLANLPKGERIRKATRMAAREIHKAEVEGIRRAKVRDKDDDDDDDDDESTRSGKSSSSGGKSGSSGDESVGDTVSSRERRSSDGGSSGSEDESFVVRDGSSESDNSDDERERDRERRLKERAGSINSLGTPLKKSKEGASTPVAASHHGVLLLGDDGLKLWRIGTAKFNQGMNWTAYLHHKQAFDNYKQHGGKFSERTFKSVIHANLVPAVCAACGLDRSKWEKLSDARLIMALEKVLRPSRSTDFAMELRELRLMKNTDEPLLARYEAFAEKFLYKCAEAEDAGKRIKWNVVKNAFNDAIRAEQVLKHWMQEVKWSGVAKAHKRLLRKLREARSIEQLFHKGKANPSGGARARDDAGEEDEDSPSRGGQPQKKRGAFKKRAKGNAARKAKAAERAAVSAGRSKGGRTNHAGVQTGKSKAPPPKGDKGPKLRQWKGYDRRGASWHTDHDLYDCYDRPCNRPFCQRCRDHGHTAEYCRKPDDVAGLTREGYAEETAKGKAALRRPPPERSVKHNGTKGARKGHAPSNSGSEEESDDESQSYSRPAVNHQRGKQRQRDDSASEDDDEREVQTSRKAGKGNAARGRRNCL